MKKHLSCGILACTALAMNGLPLTGGEFPARHSLIGSAYADDFQTLEPTECPPGYELVEEENEIVSETCVDEQQEICEQEPVYEEVCTEADEGKNAPIHCPSGFCIPNDPLNPGTLTGKVCEVIMKGNVTKCHLESSKKCTVTFKDGTTQVYTSDPNKPGAGVPGHTTIVRTCRIMGVTYEGLKPPPIVDKK